jgi:uncharacterized membrane protein
MSTLENLLFTLKLSTALGCGLIAGLFFAFSVAVMKALARLPAAAGIAAMQAINIVILNPLFLAVFFGTAVGCVVVMIAALWQWRAPGAAYLLLGGALYLIGSILVTMLINVPMNNALAAASPADPASVELWADYLSRWTAWNHVRTISALLAALFFTIALRFRS